MDFATAKASLRSPLARLVKLTMFVIVCL